MKVTWRAGWWSEAELPAFGLTHLFLADGDKLVGPFCVNAWVNPDQWKEDPRPEKCKWCREAAQWIRLVEGSPLDILKRIPGYEPPKPTIAPVV